MTAFDTAWSLLKTDVRIPGPMDVPKYSDPYANLAFYGSMNPDWRRHWDPFPPNLPPKQFAQSIDDEIARRRGEKVIPPHLGYEVGDFSEALQDGEEYHGFGEENQGVGQVYHEMQRAALIEALHDAGIHDVESLENIVEQATLTSEAGLFDLQERGQRMDNDRGYRMRRLDE